MCVIHCVCLSLSSLTSSLTPSAFVIIVVEKEMSRKKGKQSKGGWSRFLTTEAAASFRGSRGHLRYFAPTEERERYSLQQRRPLGGGGGGGGGMCRIKVNPADLWAKLPPARRVGKSAAARSEGNGSAHRNKSGHCPARLRAIGLITKHQVQESRKRAPLGFKASRH